MAMLILLTACSGERGGGPGPSASGTSGGVYKVGKPYEIKGQWYYPKEDYSYDETGIASWYGDDFHMQRTANGEIFNKNELTGAHKTLPMPSLARVTNLENGRSLVVRINDRGPFSGARIIDVTQRVAQLLGFERSGTAKVRVQVMADESRAIADAMRRYGSAPTQQYTQQQEPLIQPPPQNQTAAATQPEPTMSKAEVQRIMATFQPPATVQQVPVTGDNLIYVQAGAFTKLDNANRLKQKLSSVGAVSVADVMLKGTRYYRVRVGPIATVAEADATLKRVMKAGADGARIVVN